MAMKTVARWTLCAPCCSRNTANKKIFAWTMLSCHEFMPLMVKEEDWCLRLEMMREGFEFFVGEKVEAETVLIDEERKEA